MVYLTFPRIKGNLYFGVDPTGLIWYIRDDERLRHDVILELTPQG